MAKTLEGIDVSHHQRAIDWARVAGAGKRFMIAKASQGVAFRDSRFAANVAGARAAGLLVGSYHFADGSPVVREVSNYVQAIAGRRPGELLVLDFEGPILHIADPVGWAAQWLGGVAEATGVMPLVYMSRSVTHQFNWSRVVRLGAGLWCAAYAKAMGSPSHWPFTAMWQYSSSGLVAGVAGRVDLDTFYGDEKAWAAYGGGPAAPESGKPSAPPAPALPPSKPAAKYTAPPGPFGLPSGHFYGLITGPATSHGGYHAAERAAVRWIQVRLQELGYAPKAKAWADGKFETPTRDAVAKWQKARHAKTTTRPGEVWADDWANLQKDR